MLRLSLASPLPLLLFSSLAFLASCGTDGSAPPVAAILSPASGSPVSDTVSVQVSASDDKAVSKVKLYVRSKGSEDEGMSVGSAVEGPPFVVAWNTRNQPNQAELELVAEALDSGGNSSRSEPVAVRTQNSGLPQLQLLTAFTLPPEGDVGAQGLPVSLESLSAFDIVPPSGWTGVVSDPEAVLQPQQAAEREYVLEWQWQPTAGADGYGVYRSDRNMAGPYDLQGRYSATAGSGAQKHSRPVESQPGESFYGVVTSVTDGALVESGYSNADRATFLPAQSALKPDDGTTVASGRPSFTWSSLNGAAGYLVYIYDADPFADNATLIWSNFPQSTEALSLTYPSERDALTSGTYHWWVAGISFDTQGKADGFSFSEPRTFVVP